VRWSNAFSSRAGFGIAFYFPFSFPFFPSFFFIILILFGVSFGVSVFVWVVTTSLFGWPSGGEHCTRYYGVFFLVWWDHQ